MQTAHTPKSSIVRKGKKIKQFTVPREGEITSPARHSYSIQENRSDLAWLVSPSEGEELEKNECQNYS